MRPWTSEGGGFGILSILVGMGMAGVVNFHYFGIAVMVRARQKNPRAQWPSAGSVHVAS